MIAIQCRWLSIAMVALALGVAGWPTNAGAVSCGDNISSSITLSTSLTGCTGNGLNVTANNVTITCAAGITIDGDDSGTDSGIAAMNRSNVNVDGCTITDFYRGIRFEDVTGGSITDSTISSNLFYGIDLTRSTSIIVDNNEVLESGDEGIHVSGKLANNTCPTPHTGSNTLTTNFITDTAGEGIYLLCSDGNRIKNNAFSDNAAVGINVDETSNSNLISTNSLQNDGIQVKLSLNNTLVHNDLTDDASVMSPPARLFLDNADSNYAEDNYVDGDDATDQCFNFQNGANCNQLIRSSCAAPDLYDISTSSNTTPATPSINNRFFKFLRSFGTLCSLSPASSTVDVYDTSNTLIGCALPGPDVNPAACTWWAYDELCDDGSTAGIGGTQANAASWDLDNATVSDTQYYRANSGAVRLSVTAPLVVASTGCLSVSAATSVQLLPGTSIAGKFHAVVM